MGGPCPQCRGESVVPLARGEKYQRHQCLKCQHEWDAPVGPMKPPAEEVVRARSKEEETDVAKLSCEKGCGKEFTHRAWKDKHEAGCDGTGSKPDSKPKPYRRLMAADPKPKPPAVTVGGGIALALQALRARRDEIIATHPELLQIGKAIEALEGVSAPRPT